MENQSPAAPGGIPTVFIEGTTEAVRDAVKAAVQGAIQTAVNETQQDLRRAIQQASEDLQAQAAAGSGAGGFLDHPPEIRPHAFVVMPFGRKKGFDGQVLDFNAIYADLIKPALLVAGFEPFRADEETVSGDILTDMFQELLLADLVICDMSIDNANVFYELGIRHAFRKRGVVHIQSGRAYMPFDIFNVRTIPYHTTPEGVPDPAHLEKDRQAIVRVARDTWASDQEAIHSPVFNLLTGLSEPERKSLRTPLATGFWREYNDWKERVAIAQRQKRIGDILLLTEEISNPLIKEEAIGEAGRALQNLGRHELALQQYRKGLEVNPRNLVFRRQEAFHLNRVGQVDEAIVKLENLLAEMPQDTEVSGALGRIYKDAWIESWRWVDDPQTRLETAFGAYHWLIKSIRIYLKGYRSDLNQFYPGVNALTLATILVHLADKFDNSDDPDPEIREIRELLPELRGALTFALEAQTSDDRSDYWALASLAELRLITASSTLQVVRAYRKALTATRKNLFFLQSSLTQLEMLKSLGLRDEYVQVSFQTIEDEIRRMRKITGPLEKEAGAARQDEQVFLFTGYHVDRPDQTLRRFPPDREADARQALKAALDKFNAGANDRVFVPGASSGSEMLFIELCLERGMTVDIHLPLSEPAYVRQFVSPGGDVWIERFYHVRNHPRVNMRFQIESVGKPKANTNPYERNNRWTLYSSLLAGVAKVRLIAFWDGKTGNPTDLDGQIVKNMVEQMRRMGGFIEQVNSSQFLPIPSADDYLGDLVSTFQAFAGPGEGEQKPLLLGRRKPRK